MVVHTDTRLPAGDRTASPADQLTNLSRAIAGSRSRHEIIERACEAFTNVAGARYVRFVDDAAPVGQPIPGTCVIPVSGHGQVIGRFEVVLQTGDLQAGELGETFALLATVTGTALATAEPAIIGDPHCARRAEDRSNGDDRRKLDRDFIDHARNGQVGCIVLRLVGPDPASEAGRTELVAMSTMIDEVTRTNDVSYLSAPGEVSILLPGASRAETAMAADRIREHLLSHWSGKGQPPTLWGGVTAGRHEDPQRLAARAHDALDEAEEVGPNAIVVDLSA